MFSFFHYFIIKGMMKIGSFALIMTVFFSLIGAKALLEVESKCEYELTRASEGFKRPCI